MASSYSTLLKFELMADGEKSNTWGQVANVQFQLIEEAIAGFESVNCAGGSDVTLTTTNGASDQARNAMLKFTGLLTANINVIVPALSKQYTVWNATTGNFTITIKTSGGSGVVCPQGHRFMVICDGTDVLESLSNVKKYGKETIPIPAAAMQPSVTSGCAPLTTNEVTSGKPIIISLDFDQSSAEYAEFYIPFGKSWDEGTLTYKAFWLANDATTNGVAWTLDAVAISDNEAIAGTYGTAVTVVDNNQGSANRVLVTSESSALTVGGSPAEGDLIAFRIGRNPSHGSDNLAADARLLAIQLLFTTNAANDA